MLCSCYVFENGFVGVFKHNSAVTSLQFNRKFVVTSSDDGTVKLWSLRSGCFLRNIVELASGGIGGVVWRVRANNSKLVCAIGSRNGTEETKMLVLDFDPSDPESSQDDGDVTAPGQTDRTTRSSSSASASAAVSGSPAS